MDSSYNVVMQMSSPWLVGYSLEKDELVLYRIDQDEVAWFFWRGGLDSAGFCELIDQDRLITLGEL